MLTGRQISLRPLRGDDIGPLHASSLDLETRGPWYPLPATPLAKFEAAFAESAFWSRDEGIFAIVDRSERMVGIVGWEQLNGDLPDVEISYRLLDRPITGRGSRPKPSGCLPAGCSTPATRTGSEPTSMSTTRHHAGSSRNPGSPRKRSLGRVGTTADSGMTQRSTRSLAVSSRSVGAPPRRPDAIPDRGNRTSAGMIPGRSL